MAKQNAIEQDGTIVEALSNAMFRVELQNYAEEAEEDTIAPAAERKSNGQA